MSCYAVVTKLNRLLSSDIKRFLTLFLKSDELDAKCLETGEWPGYPESYDILDFAGYAYDLEVLDNDSDSDAA